MPEDTYLNEVRSGKVGARWALKQLQDELTETSLERVHSVLTILGHEEAAQMADALMEQLALLRSEVQGLERHQMHADKATYKAKLEYERSQQS